MAKLPKVELRIPETEFPQQRILTFDLILLKYNNDGAIFGIFLAKNYLYPVEIKDNIEYLARHIMMLSRTSITTTPISYNIKNTLIDGTLRVKREGSHVIDNSKGIVYNCTNWDVAEQLYNCLVYIQSKLWEHRL